MHSLSFLTAEDLGPLLAELKAIREFQVAAAQPADDYLSVDQVAAITNTSARTVRKWITEGKRDAKRKLIKLFKLEFSPGYPRIPRSALLAFGNAMAFDASMLPLPVAGAAPVPPKRKTTPVLDSKQALRRAS